MHTFRAFWVQIAWEFVRWLHPRTDRVGICPLQSLGDVNSYSLEKHLSLPLTKLLCSDFFLIYSSNEVIRSMIEQNCPEIIFLKPLYDISKTCPGNIYYHVCENGFIRDRGSC